MKKRTFITTLAATTTSLVAGIEIPRHKIIRHLDEITEDAIKQALRNIGIQVSSQNMIAPIGLANMKTGECPPNDRWELLDLENGEWKAIEAATFRIREEDIVGKSLEELFKSKGWFIYEKHFAFYYITNQTTLELNSRTRQMNRSIIYRGAYWS